MKDGVENLEQIKDSFKQKIKIKMFDISCKNLLTKE